MWQSLFDQFDSPESAREISLECPHDHVGVECDNELCFDCGLIFSRKFSTTNFSSTCVSRSKSSVCPIFSEMPVLIDSEIKNLAVTIYKQVTLSRIYRSTFRRSIISACLHRASRFLKKPVLFDDLLKMFDISIHEANKGIAFVAANIAKGDFAVEFFSVSLEIESILKTVQLPDIKQQIEAIFHVIDTLHETLTASSQMKSMICGCIWFYLKTFSKSKMTLKQFAAKCDMAPTTIQKKMSEIKKFALRNVLKRVFSWCLIENGASEPITDGDKLRVLNFRDPDAIKIVDVSDGFVFPLDDVDDVEDWNIFFQKTWFCPQPLNIAAKVLDSKTDVIVCFKKCPEPIKSSGQSKIENEVRSLFGLKSE